MSNTGLPIGIDVSNHQDTIDWKKVKKAGVKFAFMKATESIDFVDPYFQRNWEGAAQEEIIKGAYHFARSSRNPDARSEADFFYDTVLSKGGELQTGDCLILDQEDPVPGNYGSWALYWLQIIESYASYKPLIYTGPNFINTNQLHLPELSNYALWLANYRSTFPPVPEPWKQIAFWQYSDAGNIAGINPCDMNVFNGQEDRIKLYGKPETQIEPPPPIPKEIDVAAIEKILSEIDDETIGLKQFVTDYSKRMNVYTDEIAKLLNPTS